MGPFVFLDADNVGDDLARLFNNHTVAHPYIFALNLLGIVEARTADRCSRKLDGFQLGNRCDGPRFTEHFTLGELAHLQHQPINFEIKFMETFDKSFTMLYRGFEIGKCLNQGGRGETVAFDLLEESGVVVRSKPNAVSDSVAKKSKASLGTDSWVQ